MGYWFSIFRRDREIKYFECKFVSHEKSNKKASNKTLNKFLLMEINCQIFMDINLKNIIKGDQKISEISAAYNCKSC